MTGKQMALCGMLTALAVLFLTAGGLIPIATYCAPILAMLALLPVLEECGPQAAGTAWGAASLLALLLSPDRELALVYLFFGWYPVLRPRIARIPSRLARLAAKLVICNGIIALLYVLLLKLMGMTADLAKSTRVLNAVLLVMANVTFLLLDQQLGRLSLLWRQKLRRRFFR